MNNNKLIQITCLILVGLTSAITSAHSVDYTIDNQSSCEIIKNTDTNHVSGNIKSPDVIKPKSKGYLISQPSMSSEDSQFIAYDILCTGSFMNVASIGGYIDFMFNKYNHINIDLYDRNQIHIIIHHHDFGKIIIEDAL